MSVSDNAMGRYSGADAWIEQYFHNSPDTDREGYTSAQLEALARTHRELAQTRAPGTPLIEVHDTEHSTMVLIVNDDMPHLVSSITAYVSLSSAVSSRFSTPSSGLSAAPTVTCWLCAAPGSISPWPAATPPPWGSPR